MTKEKIPFKDRAADKMRLGMGTWSAFFGMLGFMALWAGLNLSHIASFDPYPFILLNLCLSTLAGLQGVILLIASKRSDASAAAITEHIRRNTDKVALETDQIDRLVIENTELTKQIHLLSAEIHKLLKETK